MEERFVTIVGIPQTIDTRIGETTIEMHVEAPYPHVAHVTIDHGPNGCVASVEDALASAATGAEEGSVLIEAVVDLGTIRAIPGAIEGVPAGWVDRAMAHGTADA